MAREKFQTLTEQMFYILLSFQEECCGVDVMENVSQMTSGRISIGPGTMYTLTASFEKAGFIVETAVEGRKRTYKLTEEGYQILEEERKRLEQMVRDYDWYMKKS